MAKKIEISKEQFEDCILVATSSHSEVYDSVKKHFDGAYNAIRMNYLGDIGEKALDTNDDLKKSVVYAVCLSAFLEVVRHLDLVLTPTGFGVVANSEVSPASSGRVEALIEQCRLANIKAQDLMLSLLCDIAGWGSSMQAQQSIQTVLWSITGYCYLTRQEYIASKEWAAKLAAMQEADSILRKLISDEEMDDIMSLVRGVREGNEFEGSVRLMLSRCMIMLANDMLSAYSNERARLLSYLDKNLEEFPLYANSSAYKANHFKEFKNEKSKPAFVFNS